MSGGKIIRVGICGIFKKEGEEMLYDFITADKNLKTPMYRQIYLSVRNSIENGSLKKDTKLASIRKLSEALNVSKTTVTSAYDQLCVEGYIYNKPQSGYYVAAQFEKKPKAQENEKKSDKAKPGYAYYDFSGKSIDEKIINLTEWKKNIKDVINSNYLLTSYGEAQGETVLREALQKYALGVRSVNTSAEKIIIGAGAQPLLYLLCSLLGQNKRVALSRNSFVQSEFVFRSLGYEIFYFESDKAGASVASLERIKPDIILINPNFSGTDGSNMPVTRRLEIIEWVKSNGAVIIEDDYNGELRYSTHPIPCVQNCDAESTVYLGSFSKVLLPSVRISYMVLPDKLIKKYKSISRFTNQTASKTEQLALARYINTGKIDVHLRKARRIYLEKSRVIIDSVEKCFKDCKTLFNETSLYITVTPGYPMNQEELKRRLIKSSVLIMPNEPESGEISLSFSGIPIERIDDGIRLLKKITEKSRAVK